MSYNTNPYVGRARRDACWEVKLGKLSCSKAATKYGVHRTTLWRWLRRVPGHNREYISNLSCAPKHHPNQLSSEVVARVVQPRLATKRCAPVLYAQLRNEGVSIFLSSVKRIIRRYNLVRRKKRVARYHPNIPRPSFSCPGSLVQMDTIHYIKANRTRFYLYALIDTYSRLAYAEYHSRLSQHHSLEMIKRAQKYFGFKFFVVQTDNGPEFKDYLHTKLNDSKVGLRHSRVRKPNDNAFIERFNRTIQEECFEGRIPNERTVSRQLRVYLEYYNKQRLHLGLNCVTPASYVAKVLS